MSAWTESEKRIDVPYNEDRSFLLIEHPCFVKNVDNAMKMLGGLKHIEKIYNDSHKRLPLRFRPDELYCKPVFGDQYSTTKLLMKVKRRTRTTDDNKTTVEYNAEILGHIDKVYTFNSMVDFQYLPVKKTADEKYESFSDKIVLDKLVDREEYLRQDVPLFIPPLLFSRVDKPTDSLHKRAIEHRRGYVNPDTQRPSNFIGTVRQRRSIYTIFVNFGEAVPTEPLEESKQKLKAAFVDPAGEVAIRKLFEEKPLWLKVEIEHRTGYSSDKLKTYLPAISYYWLDGPWRAQWNKFGYNPTKDPGSKIYQTIDFRIRQVRPGQINVKAKRSETNFSHWNQMSRNQQVAAKIDVATLGENVGTAKTAEDKENYYKYWPDRIPPQKLMYYPLKYVFVDEIQKMLHMNDGKLLPLGHVISINEPTWSRENVTVKTIVDQTQYLRAPVKERACDEKDGWCVTGLTDHCRDVMFSFTDRLLSGGVSTNVEQRFSSKKKNKKRKLVMFQLESEDSNSLPATNPGDSLSSMDTVTGDTVTGDAATMDTVTGDTVTGNTDTKDTVTEDTITSDTVTTDTVSRDTVTKDTTATVTADSVIMGTVTGDTVSMDTVASDTVTTDTVSRDTVTKDTTATVTADSVIMGTVTGDTVSKDTVSMDTVASDTGVTVTGDNPGLIGNETLLGQDSHDSGETIRPLDTMSGIDEIGPVSGPGNSEAVSEMNRLQVSETSPGMDTGTSATLSGKDTLGHSGTTSQDSSDTAIASTVKPL